MINDKLTFTWHGIPDNASNDKLNIFIHAPKLPATATLSLSLFFTPPVNISVQVLSLDTSHPVPSMIFVSTWERLPCDRSNKKKSVQIWRFQGWGHTLEKWNVLERKCLNQKGTSLKTISKLGPKSESHIHVMCLYIKSYSTLLYIAFLP